MNRKAWPTEFSSPQLCPRGTFTGKLATFVEPGTGEGARGFQPRALSAGDFCPAPRHSGLGMARAGGNLTLPLFWTLRNFLVVRPVGGCAA
jgi:hypothetical protein